VFILKIDKVLCFDALLQVLILKVLRNLTRIEQNGLGTLAEMGKRNSLRVEHKTKRQPVAAVFGLIPISKDTTVVHLSQGLIDVFFFLKLPVRYSLGM
jgi:hypothetical protein